MMNEMTRSLRILVGLAPCLLLACGPEAPSELEGRSFESVSVTEDGAPRALVGESRLRLSFEPNNELHAHGGCNSIDGPYSLDDGILVLEEVRMTLIGCVPSTLHEQDDWYLRFLGSKPALELDGDSLVLESSSIRVEYLDEEAAG